MLIKLSGPANLQEQEQREHAQRRQPRAVLPSQQSQARLRHAPDLVIINLEIVAVETVPSILSIFNLDSDHDTARQWQSMASREGSRVAGGRTDPSSHVAFWSVPPQSCSTQRPSLQTRCTQIPPA